MTGTEPNTAESASGFTISSSEPITEAEREYLKTPKLKPIPPDAKPGKEAKAESRVQVESVDDAGRAHDKDGKYKGAKPKDEADEKPAAKEAKPKETPAEKGEEKAAKESPDEAQAKKHDAQSRIRDLAEKKNLETERADRAERERERLARELAEHKAKPAEPRPEAKPEEPKKDARPRLKDYEDYDKYEDDLDAWQDRSATEKADAAVRKDREERAAQERDEKDEKDLIEAVEAGDKAIAEAGGTEFLDKVGPTMSRVMPSFEAKRLGLEIKPLHALGDFVVRSGRQAANVMNYIHESDPGIVDRFVEIGGLPASRQPVEVSRELGMLYGALKALHKVKASATTDNSEPGPASFKPRATPPPPSVQGSPHIAEPDFSKVDDFGEHMRLKGKRPKAF